MIGKIRNTVKHIGAGSVLIAFVILALTAGIAAYTGRHLFSTEKAVLQNRGELNAKEAAMEYNRCLLTRVNIVTIVPTTC